MSPNILYRIESYSVYNILIVLEMHSRNRYYYKNEIHSMNLSYSCNNPKILISYEFNLHTSR